LLIGVLKVESLKRR